MELSAMVQQQLAHDLMVASSDLSDLSSGEAEIISSVAENLSNAREQCRFLVSMMRRQRLLVESTLALAKSLIDDPPREL
jgi:hypothetical protein